MKNKPKFTAITNIIEHIYKKSYDRSFAKHGDHTLARDKANKFLLPVALAWEGNAEVTAFINSLWKRR